MVLETTVELLSAGRVLLSDIEHWTQHSTAEDSCGVEYRPTDPAATCFCSLGAICHLRGIDDTNTGDGVLAGALDWLAKAAKSLWPENNLRGNIIVGVNDGELDELIERSYEEQHQAVLLMWDRAIAMAAKAS